MHNDQTKNYPNKATIFKKKTPQNPAALGMPKRGPSFKSNPCKKNGDK